MLFFLLQEIEKRLKPCQKGVHSLVEFKCEKITLDIGRDGTTCDGWKICPMNGPVVNLYVAIFE